MSGLAPSPMGGPAAPIINAAPGADPNTHNHKGLFGRRHCVACQRAAAKRESGIDVPPPPGMAGDPTAHIHGVGITEANCPKCKALGVGTVRMVNEPGSKPGFAVVDGREKPGFAVVNGADPQAEPSPIGVARGGQIPWAGNRMAATPAGAGPGRGYDPAVIPSSVAPAQVPVADPSHNRPHIIGHVLGISQIRRDIKKYREDRLDNSASHASIRYDQPETAVTQLPASMVYGKDGR
jgi:hypothetical protein